MTPRQPLPHDERRVRADLQRRLPGVLAELGFADRPRGGKLMPLNPTRRDRRPGSFVIWTEGPGAGAWKDYATGEAGDVYDLIRYVKGLDRWIDAYWWSLNFLGLGRHEVRTASQLAQDRARAERERKAAEARAQAEAEAKARQARALWLGCAGEVMFTPAWRYLTEARGLPMGRLGHVPHALRWAPALEHFDRETGEVTEWPALVWAVNRRLEPGRPGAVAGVHITWLTPDGLAKAPVAKAKKMRGVIRGGAIRVWKGASKLSPEEACKRGISGPLVVTEGPEDALTAACAAPANRVWCAGSLSLMGELDWPPCASGVVLVADNDWSKPEAVAAFEAVEARWRAQAAGRPLKVVRAAVGKDLNDWARGIAA